MTKASLFLIAIFLVTTPSWAQYVPTEEEIHISKLPLPTELRKGAGVIHWDYIGTITRYRESTNGMSCNLDNPDDDIVGIRCYNDQFWNVIARSRELAEQFESVAERNARLIEEIENGRLILPDSPTAGYRILDLNSPTIDPDGSWSPTARKWQSVHFPFKTAEELGLPTEREVNLDGQQSLVPFVMSSGTWWSHVMIVHESFDN